MESQFAATLLSLTSGKNLTIVDDGANFVVIRTSGSEL
jgi:hypothetical protein